MRPQLRDLARLWHAPPAGTRRTAVRCGSLGTHHALGGRTFFRQRGTPWCWSVASSRASTSAGAAMTSSRALGSASAIDPVVGELPFPARFVVASFGFTEVPAHLVSEARSQVLVLTALDRPNPVHCQTLSSPIPTHRMNGPSTSYPCLPIISRSMKFTQRPAVCAAPCRPSTRLGVCWPPLAKRYGKVKPGPMKWRSHRRRARLFSMRPTLEGVLRLCIASSVRSGSLE